MLGLNYESSDEEDAVAPILGQALTNSPQKQYSPSLPPGPAEAQPRTEGPAIGPSLGPSVTPPQGLSPNNSASIPQSPYSSTRLVIRNLTLPPVPNFEIPPSPPRSPPPGPTKKFARFLDLKKQGVHFNERIEKSSALRNPSLLKQLTDFAGINEIDQYASTLSEDMAVPTSFPDWAYVEQLTTTQKEITKKREEEQAKAQREAIEFIPATGSGASSRAATPGSKVPRGSAAERVMIGLDREKTRSPMVQESSKRKELERRGGRFDSSRSRFRSRSRSPRRKRSRSR
ncbi:hypothetical protein AOQ84DRAFT_287419 [Glonium stellatum]|uniref:Uncharacterized protein n=1 Tax=Glonium stellatum TaxID=574774 RepID=A0A8E2JVT1_9PEZI|nr:hypothetical protein AOQ84DRAFT_287419 [Glonium stellatum]